MDNPRPESNSEDTTITDDKSKPRDESNKDGESKDPINSRPSWWRLRLRELVLTVLICCTTSIIIVTATTCHLRKMILETPEADVGHRSTCLTSDCIHTASTILENMDPEVEPCDNFYKFACGNFIRSQEVPHYLATIDYFIITEYKMRTLIRVILEEEIKPEEPKPFVQVKNMYKACMNTSLIESHGNIPYLQIYDSLGGWPVLKGDDWDESNFDWQKSVIDLGKKGFSPNHFFKIIIDDTPVEKGLRPTILVKNLDFSDNRANLIEGIKNHIVNRQYAYLVNTTVDLGAPRNTAAVEMKEAILFKANLANISSPAGNSTYLQYTIAELQIKYPIVNWVEYINEIFSPGLTVDENEVVNVVANNHLKEIEELLRKTPKRVIANYLMAVITMETLIFLPKTIQITRVEYCTEVIKKWFYKALYSLCARKYFNADARNNVTDMVNRIKAEAIKLLKNVDWMDEDTRKEALERSENMTAHMGFSDEILDVKKLEEYYKDLQIDENKFIESFVNIRAFGFKKFVEGLKEAPAPGDDWFISKDFTQSRPYFEPRHNSIEFPLGIFRGMFFSADRPQYMNYGALGFLIGHEITHAISDQGLELPLKNDSSASKWSSATEEAYLKKVQCMDEQYGNYTEEEVNRNVNGILTLSENIADNGGVKEAYLAYKKWVVDNGEEPQLPGLNYTSRQMFWLSAANMWCTRFDPEFMKLYIGVGEHSPTEFRVVGPLSNSKDFARDFRCPRGSPMNPKRKCIIF